MKTEKQQRLSCMPAVPGKAEMNQSPGSQVVHRLVEGDQPVIIVQTPWSAPSLALTAFLPTNALNAPMSSVTFHTVELFRIQMQVLRPHPGPLNQKLREWDCTVF